ncbi:integrase [Photobacterium kishitanii]|uniref:Integrase n=1 Tax=Photobacterium kishitanii TaxID=318456 RepID=A0AAX0YZI9_9GAMM|nr:tyrosine-type recombinase/integrase [Photobacterium kishitanii]KJG10801.1 integrase [Photobacterium kishitanii]KJG59806.1 integrase [Photobacterium kishitanii]KJG63091.1 integrase [Photobacterium kishitanii]KJG67894.1 integrase [Photobacterium kishitanii]KJG71265.1 integrase [Photobacterium kishitanii]
MSSIELILTQAEFATQQCPKPSDSTLERAIDGSLTGIVTYIKLANGEYQTYSRFEEDEWVFPASQGTKAVVASHLKLNFATISDTQMKRMAKWVVWSKMKEDLAIASLRGILKNLKTYFQWVLSSDTTVTHGLTAFTSNAYVKYVNTLTSKRKGEIKPLAAGTKANKFIALDNLYRYCKAFDFVKEHPWSESSATEQAGNVGEAYKETISKPKTPIIPDGVLIPLCQFTKSYLDRTDEILASTGSKESLLLRDSCIFWLLLTTGMRIHEVLGIKRGAYRSETRDDIIYYYIETVSEKTHTGLAEWIAPEIATQAIDILGQLSVPLQAQLERNLVKAKASNDYVEVHRLEQISDHICLAKSAQTKISILSGQSITDLRLPNLCKQVASDWNLSSHQFRRTFANYAVHSELGDLRALKDHFKHWSITMTALYAFNDDLDSELFKELLQEKYLVEEEIKQDWFELDTPITGGAMAQKIMQVREDGELIKVFGSLSDMAKAYSSSIPIRSTGIGWCTNDDECKCGKPDSCESGIVDKRHQPYWEGMLVQQMKLMQLDDIGEIGRESIRKGMGRCEKVLTALGVDVEAMKQEINQREHIEVINV